MSRIGILGAGSWGLSLAQLLSNNGHEVIVYSSKEENVRMLTESREHKTKLPGVRLNESISFTSSLSEAVKLKDIVVIAVPSKTIRELSRSIRDYVPAGQILVNASKGIEENTLLPMSEVIREEISEARVAVLSGPSHAEEVGRGIPTTIVVGAHSKEVALFVQNVFMSDVFRVYVSPDVLGIEVGAALKNVVALAAGIADGLGYGDNTKAALITRGLSEISRLGIKMGGSAETFFGLSGIGDLIVTCESRHSRNRKAGFLIGRGMSMDEAMKEVDMVVEGVYSTKAAVQLSEKYDCELPIIKEVYNILFNHKNPAEAVNELMVRDKKIENSALSFD